MGRLKNSRRNQTTDALFDAILSLETREECYNFFEDLCTVKEISDMAQRLEAAKMLLDGRTYDQIVKAVEISTATISRINRCIQYGSGGYRETIEKVRGTQNAMRRLVELIAEGTREAAASSLTMVLSYCNCPERALMLKKEFLEKLCGTARGDPGAHQRPVHGIRLRWRHRAGLLKNCETTAAGRRAYARPDGCFSRIARE